MGLFRKKTAPAATPVQTDGDQPKPAPYRHVPQHAAADSMVNGGQTSGSHFDRQRIALESRRRMKFAAANELPAADSAYMQAWARGALPSPRLSPYGAPAQAGSYTRSSSGFFTPLPPLSDHDLTASDDGRKAARDGHHSHWSSDSGYGSATSSSVVHSRTPSEHGKLEYEAADPAASLPPRRTGSEQSMQSEPNHETELSEASSDDALAGPVQPKVRRGVLKTRRSSPSPDSDDPNSDAQSFHSTRSHQSIRKKHTRFQQADTPSTPTVPGQYREDVSTPSTPRLLRTPSPEAQLPPLSALEGFRVNRTGLVLDEEGEVVGELADGDLLDCMRQRINACGEVIGTNDAVVGRVRVVRRVKDGNDAPPRLTEAEFAMSYLRPTMSPVLEIQDSPPPTSDSRSLYSYKGDIAAVDWSRSTPNLPRNPSTSGRPMPPPFTRHMTTGMLAMNSAQFGHAAGRRSVAYAVGVPGVRRANSMRYSYNAPLRPSPLASQEHSPSDERLMSDAASWSSVALGPTGEPISRAVSVRTAASVRTTVSSRTVQAGDPSSKSRTYFTHAGRITVDGASLKGLDNPRLSADTQQSTTSATTATDPAKKRKSRLSGMFSRNK